MRVFPFVFAMFAVLASGCGQAVDQPDHQAEWRDVLRHKKAAGHPSATPQAKQVYADSVAAFVQKHPNHGRARQVWTSMQLEFASDLASMGHYQSATRVYRAVLANDPDNADARKGLAIALDRLAVTREKLLALEKGMSEHDVAKILGKPMPGWSVRNERRDAKIEAWYYRTRTGGVAAVYFREGKVFAAEENSQAKTGRL
ncbi:MAG TPA: hypothetical protein VN181_00800 [Thermoanaerobaculia bacterium]|nr:hypothetical protein [Thermoanaerobaculia bacterium]